MGTKHLLGRLVLLIQTHNIPWGEEFPDEDLIRNKGIVLGCLLAHPPTQFISILYVGCNLFPIARSIAVQIPLLPGSSATPDEPGWLVGRADNSKSFLYKEKKNIYLSKRSKSNKPLLLMRGLSGSVSAVPSYAMRRNASTVQVPGLLVVSRFPCLISGIVFEAFLNLPVPTPSRSAMHLKPTTWSSSLNSFWPSTGVAKEICTWARCCAPKFKDLQRA